MKNEIIYKLGDNVDMIFDISGEPDTVLFNDNKPFLTINSSYLKITVVFKEPSESYFKKSFVFTKAQAKGIIKALKIEMRRLNR